MTGGPTPEDVEALLRRALAPVEPSAELAERVESTLVELRDLAADELEGWELSAMRDPRNWLRPAAAAVVGASTGTALVVLRARRRHRAASSLGPGVVLGLAERAARDLADEARRLAPPASAWRPRGPG